MTSTMHRAHRIETAPRPLAARAPIEVPESAGYRLKCRLLGRPLPTEALDHERLGNPTALAVFASDCISSSAYATEEMLHVAVPVIGLAAFSLVVPLTVALLVVLGFLVLSYRQTIRAYPTAGGAYMVTRDNFGLLPAQVAGVALLSDYILTVAVSTAAGTAALASAFPALQSSRVVICLAFVAVITFGNLRGVRESGALFRIPTFFFIAIAGATIVWGLVQMVRGTLVVHPASYDEGLVPYGGTAAGFAFGIGAFKLLQSWASGATAVTGVEAISNGVTAFKRPEWKNAQKTLVWMAVILGCLFTGLSILAAHMHVAPYEAGVPTVISQIGSNVWGDGIGRIGYFGLQAGTMLILVLAANTSFADFPRLASFHAGDNFMPKQLTKRGHRLVFSNGIIMLAVCAGTLIVATGAQVSKLIPLYAIGVFTSFTLSQAGMARHHLVHREPRWRYGLVVNGVGALLSFVVLVVFTLTKFTEGAWVIIVLVPVMVTALVRLNRQYEHEAGRLAADVLAATSEPVLRRHVVLVFVDSLDRTATRALQYARTLHPDELRAVHVAADPAHASQLAEQWATLPTRIPLELVDCPDRRISRAAVETVARELDGDTEVTVLLPKRIYLRGWHRLVHDRTADRIAQAVGRLPHANVTQVPFSFEPAAEPAAEPVG